MRRLLVGVGLLLAGASALAADPRDPCSERGTDLYLMNKCAEQRDAQRKRDAERERDRNPSAQPTAPRPGAAPLLAPTEEDRQRMLSLLRSSVVSGDAQGALRALDRIGAGPLPSFDRGVTLLMLAAWRGYFEVADRLEPFSPVTATDPHGNDFRHYAAATGATLVLKRLVGKGAECNADGWSPLALAASRRDSEMVATLLAYRYAADGCPLIGVPPLVAASAAGDAESVSLLLQAKANPAWGGPFGKTAQQVLDNPAAAKQVAQAAAAAIDRMRVEVDRVVAAQTGKPPPAGARAAETFTVPALGAADTERIVAAFAKSQASVGLAEAARTGNLAAVRSALAQLANSPSADKSRQEAVMVAVAHGQTEVLKILFERPVFVNDTIALVEAGRFGHVDTMRFLLKNSPPGGMSTFDRNVHAVLSILARDGPLHADVARFLMEAGAGMSADTMRDILTRPDDPNLLKAMIDGGFKANNRRIQGFAKQWPTARYSIEDDQTMLMFVCQAGKRPGMAQVLVDAGVDVNARTRLGRTALWYAAGNADEPTMSLLIRAKANVNLPDNDGRTPLMQFVAANQAGKHSDAPLKGLLDAGADVNARDRNGTTPLMLAYSEKAVQLLLAAGAEVNARDKNGTTPLMYAARRGSERPPKLLVDAGADVNARDQDGNTPLMYVSQASSDVGRVQMLLDAGADVLAKNKHGQSVFSFNAAVSSVLWRATQQRRGEVAAPAAASVAAPVAAPALAPAPAATQPVLSHVTVSVAAPPTKAALSPPPALSQWLPLGPAGSGDSFSLDRGSMLREGAKVMVWALRDLAQSARQGDASAIRSEKMQLELDCAAKRFRVLQKHSYAEGSGKGQPVESDMDARRWRDLSDEPDSVDVALAKQAC